MEISEDGFMQVIDYEVLKDRDIKELIDLGFAHYRAGENDNAMRIVNEVLDIDPKRFEAIILLGSLVQRADAWGHSEYIFRRAVALFPDRWEAWSGLASGIKSVERWREAISIFEKVIEMNPKDTCALTNMSCTYNEAGQYEEAIKCAEKSLSLHDAPENAIAAHDGIAMACMGLEDWGRAWDENEYSLGAKFRKEIVYGDEERWDGTKGKTVIVYGEQGLGDEIFYCSVIPDAIKDCKKVIIDCDRRLEGLFRRSFPRAIVYGTRRLVADWPNHHTWDARCAMAGLSRFYRRTKDSFPGTAFLKPDPVRSEQWKHTFKGKKKIGIAFRGGNKYTNRNNRTIPLEAFRPLRGLGDLVSLEYSKFDYGKFPVEQYDFATMAEDYDNTAALVANLDFIVTTATSVVHLAGGLGIPCYVLNCEYPAWRYANNMPWYDCVELIPWQGSWEKGIEAVLKLIEEKKAA